MDARDRLRQYFEQRRELGESEFILDGMSVEDALRAIGMQGALPDPKEHAEQAERPAGPASAARAAADKAGESGDWRAALRSVGADAPSAPVIEKIGRYEMPSAESTGEAQAAHADAKPGLSIGGDATSGRADLTTIEAVANAIAVCKACSLPRPLSSNTISQINFRIGHCSAGGGWRLPGNDFRENSNAR